MISEYSDYDLDKVLWLFEKTQNQSNLIFTDKVANAAIINRYLKKKGFRSAFIVGSDELMGKQSDNQGETNALDIIKQFKSKGINFLISVNKLLYGTDCPNADNLIIFRPTRSINLFAQMLGRGLRLGATQEANVYDCCNLIEIQSQLEHFDLFFTRTGHNYNFYTSIEKIDRWESMRLRDLAVRDYTTESRNCREDYIIKDYVHEKQDKYFIIKYKKYDSAKFFNRLKGNDLSVRARRLKVFEAYCRDENDAERFKKRDVFRDKNFRIIGSVKDESGSFYISYTTDEKDENVVDFLQL
jgi:type I site-specific restriction endonuclease